MKTTSKIRSRFRLPYAADPIDLEIFLGLKDEQQIPWKGEIEVTPGRVTKVDIVRAALNSELDGNRFSAAGAGPPAATTARPGRCREEAGQS